MKATPSPIQRALDPYRMRQRPLSVEEIAQIAAHLHIAHLAELQRLRDFQRRFEWPRDRAYHHAPRKQIVRLNNRLEHGLPRPTWRPAPAPRGLTELFDTVPHLPSGAAGAAGAGAAGAWRAARGWAAGALLLLAALFLLRATDRYFTKSYLRWRRSRSEEWPAPSVLATSDMEAPPSDAPPAPAPPPGDAPPPYSECSGLKRDIEEPPPPYSACFVEFTNPKDGAPAVHFYNSRRQNIFADIDAGASSADAAQDPRGGAPEGRGEMAGRAGRLCADRGLA